MNENDWWSDLYGAAEQSDTVTRAVPAPTRPDTADAAHWPMSTVSPRSAPSSVSASGNPAPAHTWGSGHTPDPFLQDNPAHSSGSGEITPEEAAELRRHQDRQVTSNAPVIPPMPTTAPAMSAPADETSLTDGEDVKKSETGPKDKKKGAEEELAGVKALLAKFRERFKSDGDDKDESDKGEEKQPGPVRKSVTAVTERAIHASSGHWSFLWSMGAAWTISAHTLLTACDTVARVFGAPGISGDTTGGWHLFEGPGRWFRDIWQSAWESGNPERLLFLGAVGVLPLTVMQFASRIESEGWRKALMWAGYGAPFVWAFSHYYIDSFGFRNWDDVFLSALFSAAWWGFWAAKDEGSDNEEEDANKRSDFQKFLLRIPLASLMCGVFFYSPGAAF